MTTPDHPHITQASAILSQLGFAGTQTNELAALTLLSLLDLSADKRWNESSSPLLGVTPIMNWIAAQYGKSYAPNTRESVRKNVLHHFVERGLTLYNPDKPDRPVNSPKAAYQISPYALALLRTYETPAWDDALDHYLATFMATAQQQAQTRADQRISLTRPDGTPITLSPGDHSALIRDIAESFRAHFAPRSHLLYVGDTGDKWAIRDDASFALLGITLDAYGKMPDVILWCEERGWLLLIEAVTSHGPIDPTRRAALERLFKSDLVGLVHVTAFPNRKLLSSYIAKLAWESEIWLADEPEHLIHLNGDRFLGPH
jgi:hypothetical protein